MNFSTIFVLALLVCYVSADCYMQNPRGSNNRLNEQSANRNNGDRLFDSQNNARGGYNNGDKGTNAAANNANNLYYKSGNPQEANPQQIYDQNTNRNEAVAYPMMYYAGSELQMEWTVQHGCGGNEATDPNKLNCNMVIQYMCDQQIAKPNAAGTTDRAMTVILADGLNTNTPDSAGSNGGNNCDTAAQTTDANLAARAAANDAASRGRHESEAFYCECQQRNRDNQIFVADQNLNGATAQYTRQNANGDRRGLECPEERDYYPYGPPTPFRDLAYLTDDMSRCALVKAESQNVKAKSKCTSGDGNLNRNVIKNTTPATCAAAGGTWATYQAYGIPAPDCQQAPYSRVNHLGNGRGDEVGPETSGYNATLPQWKDLANAGVPAKLYPTAGAEAQTYAKCLIRLRYNVSTDDYDPWNTFASANGKANSPVVQNPNVAVGASAKLELNINTNQFGRTFQDRSHVFFVKKPTAEVAAVYAAGNSVINLNVRGKRGNIVQTFPATEYDFVPSNAAAAAGDMIHFQNTGSNTHNNGNPGGDGQTGDAGEGTGGTDRQNMMPVMDFDDQFPPPFEEWDNLKVPALSKFPCSVASNPAVSVGTALDCALRTATNGYYKNAADTAARALQVTLDNTPASSVGAGVIFTVPATAVAGTKFRYIGTRNNNFTNRGMKGDLEITQGAGAAAAPVTAPTPVAGAPTPIAGRR